MKGIKKPLPAAAVLEETLRSLSPFGRARRAQMKCTRMSPFCFNLRSATRRVGHLKRALGTLRSLGKMCSPSINVDGTVVAGEAPECAVIGKVGTLGTPIQEMTKNLVHMRCDWCGLMDGLDGEYREAVGEE